MLDGFTCLRSYTPAYHGHHRLCSCNTNVSLYTLHFIYVVLSKRNMLARGGLVSMAVTLTINVVCIIQRDPDK